MKQRNGEKSQYHSQRVTRAMPKLETLKAKERKKERIQTRIARCEARAREERTNSRRPPPNSTVPSTSYLFASFRAEEGGRSASRKKKVNKVVAISHAKERERERCARVERETEGKEEKRPRTGLHPGLADVDGNNLSHFCCCCCCCCWFFLGRVRGKKRSV